MRRSILINVFILSSLIAYEQIKFNNISSLDKDDAVLYIGVENYIEISGINARAGKTAFNVTHSEISKVEGNRYFLRVFSQKPDTLKFYQNGHLSLKEVFSVNVIPYPVARLANSNDTILSVAQIKINPFLSVVIPGCNHKHDFQIMSFNATTISATGDSILFEGAYGTN
jgi:hypothetical protein